MLALLLPLALAPTTDAHMKVDAFFDEWADRPALRLQPGGPGQVDGPADLSARVQVAWTARRVYFATQVVDDKTSYGDGARGDRLTLIWGAEPAQRLEVVLRDLEDHPPIPMIEGKRVPGAEAVGTYRKDGWAVELSIPLDAARGLIGAPAPFAAIIHDADAKADEQARRSTAPLDPSTLTPTGPTLHLGADAGLMARYEDEQRDLAPLRVLQANLHGSAGLPETVRISPQAIAVLGHELPGGVGYSFVTHGWRTGPELITVDVADLDGRRGAELFVVHREWAVPGETQVDIAEIWGLRDGALRCLFAQKIAERSPGLGAEAVSEIERVGRRGPKKIKVHPAKVKGFNPGNYVDVDPPGMPFAPIPMPWAHKRPLVYTLEGDLWQAR